MNFNDIKSLDEGYVLQTYARNQIAIDHGQGATLFDTEGNNHTVLSQKQNHLEK